MIQDILCDFQDRVVEIRNDLIDTVAFDLLTRECFIPQLIGICRSAEVERYDLIDFIKEEMITILFESESYEKDKVLRELLDKDAELIHMDELINRINLKNKRLILFNTSKKFSNLMMILLNRASVYSNNALEDGLEIITSLRGKTYEKCFNKR